MAYAQNKGDKPSGLDIPKVISHKKWVARYRRRSKKSESRVRRNYKKELIRQELNEYMNEAV